MLTHVHNPGNKLKWGRDHIGNTAVYASTNILDESRENTHPVMSHHQLLHWL